MELLPKKYPMICYFALFGALLGVVSERFHNSRNEDDIDYKNSHRTKCFAFCPETRLRDAGFSLKYANRLGAFRNKSQIKTLGNDTVRT